MKRTIGVLLVVLILLGITGTGSAKVEVIRFLPSVERSELDNTSNILEEQMFSLDMHSTGPFKWELYKKSSLESGWSYKNMISSGENTQGGIIYVSKVYGKEELSYDKKGLFHINSSDFMLKIIEPINGSNETTETLEGFEELTEWDYYDSSDEVELEVCGVGQTPISSEGIWPFAKKKTIPFITISNEGEETFFGKVQVSFSGIVSNTEETEIITLPPGGTIEIYSTDEPITVPESFDLDFKINVISYNC